jgi:hypothetical protein
LLLRFFFLKVPFQTFLTTKIIIPSRYSLFHSRSLWDIGLTGGVLDEFFWFRSPAHFLSQGRHVFNEEVEDIVEDENEKDE